MDRNVSLRFVEGDTVKSDWSKFDDVNVQRISEAEVVTNAAYILVYRRRGTMTVPAPPSPPDP